MPNHFSTIGVELQSQEEFFALAKDVAEDCVRLDVPGGYYLRWSSESGPSCGFRSTMTMTWSG